MPEHFFLLHQPSSLQYTVHSCALGRVLLAASEKGMVAVFFGNSQQDLLSVLGQRYPQLQLQQGGDFLTHWGTTVLNIIKHPQLQHMVPLDILHGTAFQRLVWKGLRGIPAGQTRSYADVASAIGRPSAVRAVASACGANPLAVLVPCHRVVRSDGGLGGYHWGLERKRYLLALEGAL